MTQKRRLLLATFLTAFALVLVGGVVGGVATYRTPAAAQDIGAVSPTVTLPLPAAERPPDQAVPTAVGAVSPTVAAPLLAAEQPIEQAAPTAVAPSASNDQQTDKRDRSSRRGGERHGEDEDEDDDDK